MSHHKGSVMHNEHVYLFYRWKGWVAKQQGKLMWTLFMDELARREREAQYGVY